MGIFLAELQPSTVMVSYAVFGVVIRQPVFLPDINIQFIAISTQGSVLQEIKRSNLSIIQCLCSVKSDEGSVQGNCSEFYNILVRKDY